ncbi:Beta-glucuronosyltransferase GlcAT14A, partial [Bienertia sinuspersici]
MGPKKFMLTLTLTSIIFILIYISTIFINPSIKPINPLKLVKTPNITRNNYPVTFAYLISASAGDVPKLKRTLLALYHPGNYYLIHLDYGAPKSQHSEIADFVYKNDVFGQVGNVWIVGKPNIVTYRGPTMLSTTLHAMSIFLKICQWDWFINLSASDYPLVTQDDLIDAFSDLPKDLNFIHHTSNLGWKLNGRGKPIIIDPGLYSLNKSQIWRAVKQRGLPNSFKLYT